MRERAKEIGAFEAKTRLSELLRATERGASYVIRRRGKLVARLVPPAPLPQVEDLATIRASFSEIRGRVAGAVNVRELIEEGRRF
jgi:prevent-host-death family protein